MKGFICCVLINVLIYFLWVVPEIQIVYNRGFSDGYTKYIIEKYVPPGNITKHKRPNPTLKAKNE